MKEKYIGICEVEDCEFTSARELLVALKRKLGRGDDKLAKVAKLKASKKKRLKSRRKTQALRINILVTIRRA